MAPVIAILTSYDTFIMLMYFDDILYDIMYFDDITMFNDFVFKSFILKRNFGKFLFLLRGEVSV